MLEEQSIEGHEGFLRLWCPAPGIFASRATGSINLEQANAFMEFGDKVLQQRSPGVGLHDWAEMTGYGSGVRPAVSSWSLRVVSRWSAIHVYMESRVVRMGVAVVNIALGGKVRVHKDRPAFEHAVEEVVVAMGGRGTGL